MRARLIPTRASLACCVVAAFLIGCATVPPERVTPESGPAAWRVASYNIRHGRGMDDRVDLQRTAEVLRRLDADIVALQEVDQRVARSGDEDQAARIGELLGMHHVFGGFMEYQGGRYGMAILSRCEIRNARPLRLTDGNEPRVALAVEVAAPDGTLITVVNVHFDWVADDGFRFTQASEVARYLDDVAGPWIAIGDFNDERGSRTINLFHARGREAAKPRGRSFTFPSTDPQKEIDFIFVAPEDRWSVSAVEVVEETMASDHRPVSASLVLARPHLGSGRTQRSIQPAGVDRIRERPIPLSCGRVQHTGSAGSARNGMAPRSISTDARASVVAHDPPPSPPTP